MRIFDTNMRIRNNTHVADKIRGKKRRQRDHAEKLARAAKEEVSPDTEQQISPRVFFPGGCEPTSCGHEAACIPYQDNRQHYCLCTNNGKPPTKDYKCPRSTVPLTPKPIYNVIPPRSNNSNSSTDKYSAPPPTDQEPKSLLNSDEVAESTMGSDTRTIVGAGVVAGANAGTLAVAAVVGAFLIVLLGTIVFCYMRRRYCVLPGKTQPRVRPGEPLIAERYIRNPHYGFYRPGTISSAGQPVAGNGGDDPNESRVPLLESNALTFLEEIGEGCFGKVHKGMLRTNNGEEIVAVKVLKESAGRSAEEDFVREVSIMSAFQHSNILTLLGVVYRDDTNSSPWMVFEYMEWGDLAGVLRGVRNGGRAGPVLDEPSLLHVALQVARGMQYLASRRFVHRDLAARNCLVGAGLTVKIADFGMSRDVYTCDYYKMGGERPMPVRWMSPESITYARFTHESDVWSFGVVLWEIYSRGKQPFYGHNNEGAAKLILQGIVLVPPEDCPTFACELMRCCWRSDPKNRIGFDEICSNLELAAVSCPPSLQIRLPRPPPQLQDSAGYLIPVPRLQAEYLATLPDPSVELGSSDDEEEEEYT